MTTNNVHNGHSTPTREADFTDLLDPELVARMAERLYFEIPKNSSTPGIVGAEGDKNGHEVDAEGAVEEPYKVIGEGEEKTEQVQSHTAQPPAGDVMDELHVEMGEIPRIFGEREAVETTPLCKRMSLQRPYFLPGSARDESASEPAHAFDVNSVRRDFPILHQKVHGKQLVWLDNAATSQKPTQVIETVKEYYETINSNIHRGAHDLAEKATEAYEGAREVVRKFIGAGSAKEIVFVRGATEAINLVAQTFGRKYVGEGDEIVVTMMEHHSNIVPWQLLARERGAMIRVAPLNDKGEIVLGEYEKLLNPKTRLAALTHVSNALGTVNPVGVMVEMAHRRGIRVIVDGAQSVPHFRVNVQSMDVDFFAFSGHKVFGPTGIGVLYGKKELLDDIPPWQGGGSMIESVSFDETTYKESPAKFEAGTPNIADAVGLRAAFDYLDSIGFEEAARYERELMNYATRALDTIQGLRQIGTADEKVSVLSFVIDGLKAEDIGAVLDREGIAVRAGHHCAQPALRRFGLMSTVRPSLAFYNTYEEIEALVSAIRKAKRVLAKH